MGPILIISQRHERRFWIPPNHAKGVPPPAGGLIISSGDCCGAGGPRRMLVMRVPACVPRTAVVGVVTPASRAPTVIAGGRWSWGQRCKSALHPPVFRQQRVLQSLPAAVSLRGLPNLTPRSCARLRPSPVLPPFCHPGERTRRMV
jgi:hypothetical protein